jgi:hypothetical protein
LPENIGVSSFGPTRTRGNFSGKRYSAEHGDTIAAQAEL